ncbi:hypothetical protein ACRALDRAFT_2140907 [Sodiomyces alcalophilus JCM 7366]|uniref:uncharacterized protein n=1 Tax=Sodiomyces alcalophilus JCM 7366 TaxID=591952 RepID=UPI0039B47BE1
MEQNHNNSNMPPAKPAKPVKPRVEYSPHKRTLVAQAYRDGLSQKAIALKFNVSPGSVWGIARRYQEQSSARSKKRTGRPPALGPHEKRRILRAIMMDPFISPAQLLVDCGLSCSRATLTRYLHQEGIPEMRSRLQRSTA